jgi:hypothetical protein
MTRDQTVALFLAESYAERFLQKVKAMASELGGLEKRRIVEAFMQRVEKVMTLQENIGPPLKKKRARKGGPLTCF